MLVGHKNKKDKTFGGLTNCLFYKVLNPTR